MPNAPRFEIDDVIYLRESALLGFIESYKIGSIKYDNTSQQWLYTINIRSRGPVNSTLVDRVDLSTSGILEFRETELLDFCGAITLAIEESQRRLDHLKAVYQSRCGGSTTP